MSDLESATRFYSEVLRFKPIDRPDSLPDNGVWLEGYGFQIHLIEDREYRSPGLANPSLPDKKHFALTVDDIHDFRQYLIERTVTVGDLIEIGDGRQQFFFCDPADNPIEITNP
ncbi:MAG: VOC family protein [Candidatus Thiosymbion ectosymbiont of Robbea hypermnestra]|nr:VOC family protein [Candidatus Thiosymbion ectosymbiont of Robbea hypermnestra]